MNVERQSRLANVLLDELDRELESRGLRFCRYADDCIIFVRTLRAGERVLTNISRHIEEKLKLKVNQQKSKVDIVTNCTYLGYIIGKRGMLRIAPTSVKKLKAKVRIITRRNRPTPLREVIAELTPVIRGVDELLQAGSNKRAMSGIAATGRRWRRIACSEPANICMDNAWLRAEGYISFYQLFKR